MRRFPFSDTAALIALLLVAPIWLALAFAGERAISLTSTSLSVLLPASNFHELEPLVDRAGSFRWTTAESTLQPPNPGGPLLVDLTLASGFPTSTEIELRAADYLARFEVGPGLRAYHLVLPPQPGERVELTISAPPTNIDGRDLGVMWHALGLSGGRAAPLSLIGLLLLATAAAYPLLRRSHVPLLIAAGIVLTLQVLVAFWLHAGAWQYGFIGQLLLLASAGAIGGLVIERIWPPTDIARDPPHTPLARRDRLALGGLLLLALALCLPWLGAPDPVGDLELSARRMGFMVAEGFAGMFTFGGDYMPLRLYLLRGLAELVPLLNGAFFEPLPPVTRAIIKLPSLFALLITIGLLFRWARCYGGTGYAAMIAGLYAVVPPVWMNVAWWGQVDVLLAMPMVAALTLIDRGDGRAAWLSWAAALMIKPQAIILAPLIYAGTLRRHGPRGLLIGGSVAIGVIVLLCAPIVLAGQGRGLAQAAIGSVGRFPQVTNRAYNLWWLVVDDDIVSDLSTFGPFSYRTIGFLLVGVAALISMLALLRNPGGLTRALAAAALALAFFALPTQIHERYSFFALPFLLLAAAIDRRAFWPFGLLTFAATINLFGAIRGFGSESSAAIRASPLPVIVAWLALAILIGLLIYAWRTAESVRSRKV
ncbi:MAG: hypothetical protein HC822_01630 [Oscillochloris sp.]|nr:hypothetical protein [Oscillochloris sp.]